uniref:DNA2/NAM7 helicase-like C-terminal domain-containing protein n=1 Tax=Panagrolaimus superbus TaxID=310955 RepID=A0A914YFC4_9BILA
MNKEQAEISIQIALQLKQFHPDKSVIVVSPYSKQNEYVKNCSKINDITTVEHSSLDALQGAERDFVILNLTISGKQNNNTFINENGRFTVAVTRARLGLIIVGDLILMQKLCSWKQFIQMLKEKKNIVH